MSESARVARRLMTSHGLRGLVRKEKIVQEVAMRSDMWSYLDDDFHVEAMNYIIIAWLWFATKVPQTPKSCLVPTRKTDKGRTLRLPHRFRE